MYSEEKGRSEGLLHVQQRQQVSKPHTPERFLVLFRPTGVVAVTMTAPVNRAKRLHPTEAKCRLPPRWGCILAETEADAMSPTLACESVPRSCCEIHKSCCDPQCCLSVKCLRCAQQALRHLSLAARSPVSLRIGLNLSIRDRRAILHNGALKRLPQNVPTGLVAAQHDAGVCDF
jgi:hypothetical protein